MELRFVAPSSRLGRRPPHGRTPRLHRIVGRTRMTALRFATVCWAQVHSRVRQRSNVGARRIVGLENGLMGTAQDWTRGWLARSRFARRG